MEWWRQLRAKSNKKVGRFVVPEDWVGGTAEAIATSETIEIVGAELRKRTDRR